MAQATFYRILGQPDEKLKANKYIEFADPERLTEPDFVKSYNAWKEALGCWVGAEYIAFVVEPHLRIVHGHVLADGKHLTVVSGKDGLRAFSAEFN